MHQHNSKAIMAGVGSTSCKYEEAFSRLLIGSMRVCRQGSLRILSLTPPLPVRAPGLRAQYGPDKTSRMKASREGCSCSSRHLLPSPLLIVALPPACSARSSSSRVRKWDLHDFVRSARLGAARLRGGGRRPSGHAGAGRPQAIRRGALQDAGPCSGRAPMNNGGLATQLIGAALA